MAIWLCVVISIAHQHANARCWFSSQCSTFTKVRKTVVRAILQAYGKWWISTPWGAETAEPIEVKLGMGTPPHMHKTKSVCKGVSFGGGVKCSTQACFFSFLLFFCSLNGPPAYPVRIGWALTCTQKRVLVVSWFLGGEIPPKSNVPILWGKNPLFSAKNRPRLTNGFNMGWIG